MQCLCAVMKVLPSPVSQLITAKCCLLLMTSFVWTLAKELGYPAAKFGAWNEMRSKRERLLIETPDGCAHSRWVVPL